jgi:predicted PurR-regulated permease PerM
MKVSAQDQTVVRFEITPRSCALMLATVAGVWLAYKLRLVALILLMALILAGTFNPMVEWMEARRITRVRALILLLLALTACAALLLFLTFPPLIEQITEMIRTAPDTRARLIALLSEHTMTVPLAHVLASDGLERTFAHMKSDLLGYTSLAARVAGYGATTLALSIYLLADGKRAQGVAYAIVPRDYHMRLARILQNMETIVGGYMRGQLITSTSIGVFTFALLAICKVPNALAFALFASVVDVLPFIGGLLIIPPAVIAALPNGLPTAGVVFVAFCVYTEFESRILVPKVYGQVLRLSPTVVILALLAGGSLMGVVGALIALPIAAGLLMILEELRVEMPGDDSVDRAERARQAKTEATYEQMSAGATAPEAGQIARHLAHDMRDADLTNAASRAVGAVE